MPLSELERRVAGSIAEREHELVELLAALIGFDTTTHAIGAPPRDEERLQRFLADRLERAGAKASLVEPDARELRPHPMIPEGFSFDGRPQLVARFPAGGAGRTLLLNGHVDVVSVEPRAAWRSDPFVAAVEDGRVRGRGACDMKGGVAAMVFAAETLAELGVALAGELIVNTVSEEESTGAGGLASARTLSADGAIVPEPSGLAVWIACRGSLLPRIHIQGRAGHAGIPPKPHAEGGAVNAIEKTGLLLEAIARLREEWSHRPRHRFLAPADAVPTMIKGGEWLVSYPAECTLDVHLEYLPAEADESGWGSRVKDEFAAWIEAAAAADPWLCDHQPRIEWVDGEVPPAEVAEDDPLVVSLLATQRDLAARAELGGLDNWHDGATLTVEAGIPAVCFGPGDIAQAHTVDESVPIADLVACAQGIAIAAMRYCGVSSAFG
jgi:acetylornithine deacetylase